MKNTKQNQGITLIALVITIIVMLILVAVTINMAVNGGLFAQAGRAVGDTRNAINAEQALANGQIKVGGVIYNSIEDYVAGTPAAGQPTHIWERNGDTFTCQICRATYNMGQTVNYSIIESPTSREKAEAIVSTTITAKKSGLDKYFEENGSYPYDFYGDETNGTQTVELYDVPQWIVLGIEDIDKDGLNETLLITTAESVETNLYVYGAADYNNMATYYNENGVKVEGELDRICKELFSNSQYGQARSINVDDVNNALNYSDEVNRLGGMYADTEGNFYATGNFETKLKDLPIFKTLIGEAEEAQLTPVSYDIVPLDYVEPEILTPDGLDTATALGEYELNGYMYKLSEDGTALIPYVDDPSEVEPSGITPVERNVIFGDYNNYYNNFYSLSNRSVMVNFFNEEVGLTTFFGTGSVHGNGNVLTFGDTLTSPGRSYETQLNLLNLRPVVPLQSKLPTGGEQYEW